MPDQMPKPPCSTPATARTELIIDCDPGIDDAVSLALAANSSELNLRGVTTVAGNVELSQTTANALALLNTLGRDDVRVAAGADQGLVRPKPPHAFIHGRNGLGGVRLPPPSRRPDRDHAVALLAAQLRASPPRSVTIAAIGPLTNIALLAALHPELIDRIARVVVMGASSAGGNVTPLAEYNTWADPEAAHRVLSASGLNVCLVELQVTRQATLDSRARRALKGASPLGAVLSRMIEGYADGAPGERALHDVVVVAAIIDPTLIATRPGRIEVRTSTGADRGQTVLSVDESAGDGSRLQVAVDLDAVRLREMLLSRIGAAAVLE